MALSRLTLKKLRQFNGGLLPPISRIYKCCLASETITDVIWMDMMLSIILKVTKHKSGPFLQAKIMIKKPVGSLYIGSII